MNQEEQQFLQNYHLEDYPRPSVTSDIAVFAVKSEAGETYRLDPKKKLCLLLIQRGQFPFKGSLALPGGFLRPNETIEACAARELREETGAKAPILRHIGVFSNPSRDPRGWIVSNAFLSVLSEEILQNMQISGGDDAAHAEWFEIDFVQKQDDICHLTLKHDDVRVSAVLRTFQNIYGMQEFEVLENGGLAFDHAQIIAAAVSHLRRETKQFSLIFDFLPEQFTLADLQKIEELISGKSLLASNYRRKAENFLEFTGNSTNGSGHRPARLFRRKVS